MCFAARRQKGFIPLSTYLTTYKLGDYVDIKANAAVHKVRMCCAASRRQLRAEHWAAGEVAAGAVAGAAACGAAPAAAGTARWCSRPGRCGMERRALRHQ